MKKLILLLTFVYVVFANDCDDKYDCANKAMQAASSGNYELAYKLYKKSCELGHQSSCEMMKTYDENQNFALHTKVSKEEFEAIKKACEAGDAKKCEVLSALYMLGKGIKKDYGAAYKIAEIWCEKDSGYFCLLAGIMHNDGVLGKADYEKAREFYLKGCKKLNHAESCTNLGMLYLLAQGVEFDKNLALEYINQGCESGDNTGCMSLGEIHFKDKEYTKALPYLKFACENNNAASCMYAGISLMPREYTGSISEEAAYYFDKACKMGIQEGCLDKK